MAREVEQITSRFFAARRDGQLDLGAAEFEVRAALHKVGSVLLEHLLNADHGGHRGPRLPCGHGHQAEFIDYRTKHVHTILGPVQVRRAYYCCAQCPPHGRRGLIPKDQELDVVGTSFSPGLRRLMARVGAQEAFAMARQDLAELAGVVVPIKAVERISEAVGVAAEAANQVDRAALLSGQGPPIATATRLYVEMDGTGVPAVPHDTQGRTGKAPDGTAKTREAKLGCVFTQTSFDAQGWPVRDPESTTYVGAIETAEEFGPRLHAEAVRRGYTSATTVIVLGDGAPWIWHRAEADFPGAVQIVDLYHAREHLEAVGRLAFGSASETGKAWVAARRDELDAGDVAIIVREIGQLARRHRKVRRQLRNEAEYFDANKLRMCYKYFRARGFFVGSGVVEAGCKTLIGHRLKQSGMRWTVAGANAIIALRCRLLGNRWEDLWRSAA
ncbi:MAG TPA: ISKra4 family transposase [Candidatus Margulisiibacteriota bacterium]|nr:ISKra4 family transposase [Candidatus Margulisiibacteriota bacterium]